MINSTRRMKARRAANATPAGTASSVTALSRDLGPAAGGVQVVITGTGFSGTPAVLFGAAAATGVVVNSPTQLTCTAPAGAGTVAVSVAGVAGPNFEFCPAPTALLNKVITFEDGTLGGSTVVVNGGNTVTNILAAGDGPLGSNRFARCRATGIDRRAYLANQTTVNTPLNGGDGYWNGYWIRIPDATIANIVPGHIKLSLNRDPTPRWHNEVIGAEGGSREPPPGYKQICVLADSGQLFDANGWTALQRHLIVAGTAPGWIRIDRQLLRVAGAYGRSRLFVNKKLVLQDQGAAAGHDAQSGTITQENGISYQQNGNGVEYIVELGGLYVADGYVEDISGAGG